MRGTLAKVLRRVSNQNVPLSLPSVSAYERMPGTTRIHTMPYLAMNEDGTIRIEQKEAFQTFTARLAPTCRRYFTQRFKRAYVKGIH